MSIFRTLKPIRLQHTLAALAVIAITLPQIANAGEWKNQSHQDSIIELWAGWNWTKPERGKYGIRWRDDFSVSSHEASWNLRKIPRISVRVERLAPNYGSWYGSVEEWFRLDEEFLTWWQYLNNVGVSDIVSIQCDARDCVTFTAGGIYSCGAFTHWSGQLNGRNDTDLIGGYYCAGRSNTVTAENINMIFASIAIRGIAGGYEKRATTANIADPSQEEVVDDLSARAEQGDAVAQYILGQNYLSGNGVQRSTAEARRWYLRAAENGHSEAQYEIGYLYERGRSVGKDQDVALNWYRKAAAQENVRAQFKIGLFYEQGWAVLQDLDEALVWYRKAANQGHALAVTVLDRLQTTTAVEEPPPEEDVEVETSDISERLRKVKHFLDEGLISESEAAAKRKAILDEF